MSDSSDVELIEECSDMNEVYENDIEEIVVGSSSNEDEPVMNVFVDNVEEDENVEILQSYDFLQSVILDLPGTPSTRWKRMKILKKGVLVCKELVKAEINLRAELEALLQQNWLLKRRVKKLKRMKKRKSGSIIVTRRASGPVVGAPKCISPEKKRVSLDDSKTAETDPDSKSNIKTSEENAIEAIDKYKNPRKKPKKRIGLTEEEKEFHMIEEKLEDLLYEVDVLWNEVKDDEETDYEEDVDDPKQEIIKGDEDKAEVSKCCNLSPSVHSSTTNHAGVKSITIENIGELMAISHKQEAFITLAGTALEKYGGEQSQVKSTSVSNENYKLPVTEFLPDNMLSRMNEPTTSISPMNTTVKNIIDRTEVINISDGSDSDSDVVCIG